MFSKSAGGLMKGLLLCSWLGRGLRRVLLARRERRRLGKERRGEMNLGRHLKGEKEGELREVI